MRFLLPEKVEVNIVGFEATAKRKGEEVYI